MTSILCTELLQRLLKTTSRILLTNQSKISKQLCIEGLCSSCCFEIDWLGSCNAGFETQLLNCWSASCWGILGRQLMMTQVHWPLVPIWEAQVEFWLAGLVAVWGVNQRMEELFCSLSLLASLLPPRLLCPFPCLPMSFYLSNKEINLGLDYAVVVYYWCSTFAVPSEYKHIMLWVLQSFYVLVNRNTDYMNLEDFSNCLFLNISF